MDFTDTLTYDKHGNMVPKKATDNMIRIHERSLIGFLTNAVEYCEWMEEVNNHSSSYRAIADTLRQQLSIVSNNLAIKETK